MPTGLLTGSATISNASHPSATPPMRWTDQTPYDYPAALPAITVSSGSASLLSEVPLPAVTMPRDGWCYRTASLQSLPSAGDPSNSIIATTVDLIATQCINTHQVMCARPVLLAPVFIAISGAYQLRFFSQAKLSKEEAVRVCVQDSGTLASPLSSDLGMVSQRLQTEFPSTRQGLPMAWINATAASRGGVLDAHCVALAAGGVPVAANCQTELPFVCQREWQVLLHKVHRGMNNATSLCRTSQTGIISGGYEHSNWIYDGTDSWRLKLPVLSNLCKCPASS